MTFRPLINSLAVVLPRYGESLGGGAEALTKALIEQLAKSRNGLPPLVPKVEVWTTCARDHRTWANELPEGVTVENEIIVRRFPVDSRNLDIFIKHEIALSQGESLTVDEQLEWLSESVNSKGLYQQIAQYGIGYDCLLFAPYLFATSYWGAHIYPERSVIIPCLHNEPYAYQPVFRHLFQKVRGLICNAAPEKELVLSICGAELEAKSAVVGMGFERAAVRASGETQQRPYLLYSGRKERGKNADLLLSFYDHYRRRYPSDEVDLLFIGAGDLNELGPLPSGVRDLGFVTEEEKGRLLRNALCLCQPSTNESFSIVMMEAWLQETPVLVHGNCAVTRHHVVQSCGGLYFKAEEEFGGAVHRLYSDKELRNRLGKAGREYVTTVYSWDAVLERLREAFDRFGLTPHGKASETTDISRGSR